MTQTRSEILIALLNRCPDGICAKDAANHLGWHIASTGGLLSRLHCYGKIDRDKTNNRKGSMLPMYIYKIKPSAPPIAPLQPGSIAERNAKRVAPVI